MFCYKDENRGAEGLKIMQEIRKSEINPQEIESGE